MKKFAILLIFVFASAMITSCKSSKKGCGLTGDINTPIANPIQQAIQNNIIQA